jgi:hypothetical protein
LNEESDNAILSVSTGFPKRCIHEQTRARKTVLQEQLSTAQESPYAGDTNALTIRTITS